jgi:hypothetical protein
VTVGGPRVAGVRFTVSLHNEFEDIGRFADALAAEAKTLQGVRRPVPLAAE